MRAVRLWARLARASPRVAPLRPVRSPVRFVHHQAPQMPSDMAWDPREVRHDTLDDPELQRLNEEGTRLMRDFKDSEASKRFAKVLERDANNPVILRKQALTISTLPGRNEEANKLITKAIAVAGPMSADLWDTKGFVLRVGGKFEEALQCLDRAIQLNPQFGFAHWNKALCLNALRRFGPALLSFERTLDLIPDVAEVDYDRGRALFFLGREEEAFAWLTDARINESSGRSNFYFALRACRSKNFEEALKFLAQTPVGLRLNAEDTSDVDSWRGECHLALGQHQKALESFDAALAKNASDALSLHGKGEALLKLGTVPVEQVQKDCFDKALVIDPIYYKSDYFRIKTPRYK